MIVAFVKRIFKYAFIFAPLILTTIYAARFKDVLNNIGLFPLGGLAITALLLFLRAKAGWFKTERNPEKEFDRLIILHVIRIGLVVLPALIGFAGFIWAGEIFGPILIWFFGWVTLSIFLLNAIQNHGLFHIDNVVSSVEDEWKQCCLDNDLFFRAVEDVENPQPGKRKIRYLPANIQPTYIDIKPYGFSPEMIDKKRSGIEGSLDIEIVTIENPVIKGKVQKAIIRLWYSREGLPAIVHYNELKLIPNEIVFGVSVKGQVSRKVARMEHFLVYAMTGKGKSEVLGNMIAQLYGMYYNITFLLIDFKGGESFHQYDGRRNIVTCTNIDATDFKETYIQAITYLEAVDEIMKMRQRQKAEARKSRRKISFPPIWVFLDEAQDFFTGWRSESGHYQRMAVALIVRICQLGRSTNVHFCGGTQRPAVEFYPSDIRTNTSTVIGGKTGDGPTSRLIFETERLFRMVDHPGRMMIREQTSSTFVTMQTPFINMDDGIGGEIVESYEEKLPVVYTGGKDIYRPVTDEWIIITTYVREDKKKQNNNGNNNNGGKKSRGRGRGRRKPKALSAGKEDNEKKEA